MIKYLYNYLGIADCVFKYLHGLPLQHLHCCSDWRVLNDSSFSALSLESALKHSGIGKRSKQRFLKTSLKDDTIKKSSRGAGGNTNTFKCYIIKQSEVPDETIQLLAKGVMCMRFIIKTICIIFNILQ